MQLREIMTHEEEVIHPDATLEAASQKMRESNPSALPVCDGQQLVGILTERDLIVRSRVRCNGVTCLPLPHRSPLTLDRPASDTYPSLTQGD